MALKDGALLSAMPHPSVQNRVLRTLGRATVIIGMRFYPALFVAFLGGYAFMYFICYTLNIFMFSGYIHGKDGKR